MIKLRKLSQDDLSERVSWMNSPLVYKTMHFVPPISLENTIEWYNRNQKINTRCDVVFEDQNGQLVAMGGLTAIDYSVRKAEFYIFVNPERQKEGIGTKATKLLCKYGFEILNLHKIYLYTNASNTGACKTYEKVGFHLEGTHRDEMIFEEKYQNRLYYGLLASEFVDDINLEFKGWNDVMIDKINIDDKNITIVRDDLYPQSGGGIKSRKSATYELYMINGRYNSCVTTGGIQSNHNRAIALMCARHGWKCHLVYHGTRERFEAEKGNALLARKSGAELHFVTADEIGSTMDTIIKQLKNEGYKPMYIHGGGHDMPGGIALVEAVKSLKSKCDRIGYKPKYIFHASGTGSTQAGIVVGLDLIGWSDVKVIGISVARQKTRGTEVIQDFANQLASFYGLPQIYKGKIDFNTDYLFGGYEKFSEQMKDKLDEIMSKTGIMFDTTYSGKAFFGMLDYTTKHSITDGVLFWHTGGLMNLMQ